MNQLKRFFEPLLVEPVYIYKLATFRILQGFAGVFNIFMVKDIISMLEKNDMQHLQNYIIWYGIINIILFSAIFLCRNWSWGELAHHLFKMIHRIHFRQFNELDNTYLENIGTGKVISIYTKGTWTWINFLLDSFEVGIKLIFSLGASMILLASIGNIAITVFFVVFIFVHVLIFFLNKKAKQWRKGRIDAMHEYDRQTVKIVMSKFEILQNNKMDREIKVMDRISDEAKYYNIHLNNYLMTMLNIPNIVFFVFTFALLLIFTSVQISFATMISIFMILGLLKENMYASVNFFKNFTKDIYQIHKLWELFDDAPKISGLTTGDDFEYKKGEIEIKNLDFSYGSNKVFEKLDLRISGSKKTALVGKSGSGKTTLVKLISGFIHQNAGDIIVDGQNLQDINLSSYYKNIGYLTQEPSVFDGSIFENLIYGMETDFDEHDEKSMKKIQDAITLASADFVYKFPDGLHTQIGERGVRLSGGQKQRLAIAKLFIKNPQIIILDEPTSALDSFSEEDITDSFEKLFAGRTVLVIAHRLQTVQQADEIIVFEEGKIIERGTHAILIAQNGYYKKMLDLQSGF